MRIIAITVAAGLLLLASGYLRVLAQPAGENDRPVGRPGRCCGRGEVKIPARYFFTNGLTLTTAIKMAKGFTDLASPKEVSLIRTGAKPLVVDVKAIEQGKAKDIELRPGDKVQVQRKQPR